MGTVLCLPNIYYTYDATWKDKLVSYNGSTITYDAIGNPLSYRGKTLTWQRGRQLATANNGSATYTYKYDVNGQRIKKITGSTTTTYRYVSGLLVSQTNGTQNLYFRYDANGTPRAVKYNGTDYYYLYNLQGDVVTIYNSGGAAVVNYVYDSWGKLVSTTGSLASTLGVYNPFRYRGYVYDTETGFYYLNSRYYDPETGRFINLDEFVTTGQGVSSFNMYSYCGNNPVNRIDPTGSEWKDVVNFYNKAWNGLTSLAKNTFGAESSTKYTSTINEQILVPDPSPITIKTGVKHTQTISKHGDASKPISVYANLEESNPAFSSSAGIKLNIAKTSAVFNVGLDDVGISGSITNGNQTNSIGIRLNISELKAGIEFSSAIKWDDYTEISYWNISASGWFLATVFAFATSGQWVSSPQYAF